VENIRRWIEAKGLDLNAWAVAKNMAKRGSKDWRNKAPNVFLSAIDDFENNGGAESLTNEVAGYFEEQVVEAVVNNWKA
jgi:hypothetical protein